MRGEGAAEDEGGEVVVGGKVQASDHDACKRNGKRMCVPKLVGKRGGRCSRSPSEKGRKEYRDALWISAQGPVASRARFVLMFGTAEIRLGTARVPVRMSEGPPRRLRWPREHADGRLWA